MVARKRDPILLLMNLFLRYFFIFISCIFSHQVLADYKDDIEYTRLETELGGLLPSGDVGTVSHIEAYFQGSSYLPDSSLTEFSSDTITDASGLGGSFSTHARNVGRILYGNHTSGIVSMAHGTNFVDAYQTDDYFGSGFLNLFTTDPKSSVSRLGNHSYVANVDIPTYTATALDLLTRMDWLINEDEFINIVGVANSTGVNPIVFSSAFNTLAVGKTNKNHSTGSPFIDSLYTADRTRTEIVAPFNDSSSATPVISATAALLIDLGHSKPTLSTDTNEVSTTNREGNTIYNAERSEVVKAALLAGANRITQNTSISENITDYRALTSNQSHNGVDDNGLDIRYGAGQVNAYYSYHIVAGGEQNSNEDSSTSSTDINKYGFDYDPSFGGNNSSNTVASYNFSTGINPQVLTTSLVWNLEVTDINNNPNIFSPSATLYNLDLYLYDVTSGKTEIANSDSTIDNSENIWTSLDPNKDYLIEVIPKSGQNNFDWDYALTWRINLDTDGDGIANDVDVDDDNDGLTDSDEKNIYFTDPLDTDSDNDSYTDDVEVLAGSDPNSASSTPTSIPSIPTSGLLSLSALMLIISATFLPETVNNTNKRR